MEPIRKYKDYLVSLLSLSWPNIVTNFLSLAIPLSSMLAVGHIGPTIFLGAAALGGMFTNATGIAIGMGLSMALDTLCSQAYGAKKYKLVGLQTQRSMVILTLISIPLSILWFFSGYLLRFISDGETAELSQLWVRILIPSMWPRFMSESYRRYLLGQQVVWPITASNTLSVPIHIAITYIFTFYFGWGFAGAAWAVTISTWVMFLSMVIINEARVIYLRRKGTSQHVILTEMREGRASDTASDSSDESLEEGIDDENSEDLEDNGDPLHTWPALSRNVFSGWIQFLRLGFATSVSLFIEWGSFEVNAVIAAKLGDVPLAAHSVLCYTAGVWYTPPSGLASAATSLVGNMLGAGRPQDAAIYAKLSFVINLVYALANGALGLVYKNHLGKLWTNDDAVISLVSQVMFVMAVYGVADAIKCIGNGLLRGSGRPAITVYTNILSCLIVGYPIALLLVFKADLGLQGLWMGMTCAWTVASSICVVVMSRTNWEQEVQNAKKRNEEEQMSAKDKMGGARKMMSFTLSTSDEDDISILTE